MLQVDQASSENNTFTLIELKIQSKVSLSFW